MEISNFWLMGEGGVEKTEALTVGEDIMMGQI